MVFDESKTDLLETPHAEGVIKFINSVNDRLDLSMRKQYSYLLSFKRSFQELLLKSDRDKLLLLSGDGKKRKNKQVVKGMQPSGDLTKVGEASCENCGKKRPERKITLTAETLDSELSKMNDKDKEVVVNKLIEKYSVNIRGVKKIETKIEKIKEAL